MMILKSPCRKGHGATSSVHNQPPLKSTQKPSTDQTDGLSGLHRRDRAIPGPQTQIFQNPLHRAEFQSPKRKQPLKKKRQPTGDLNIRTTTCSAPALGPSLKTQCNGESGGLGGGFGFRPPIDAVWVFFCRLVVWRSRSKRNKNKWENHSCWSNVGFSLLHVSPYTTVGFTIWDSFLTRHSDFVGVFCLAMPFDGVVWRMHDCCYECFKYFCLWFCGSPWLANIVCLLGFHLGCFKVHALLCGSHHQVHLNLSTPKPAFGCGSKIPGTQKTTTLLVKGKIDHYTCGEPRWGFRIFLTHSLVGPCHLPLAWTMRKPSVDKKTPVGSTTCGFEEQEF